MVHKVPHSPVNYIMLPLQAPGPCSSSESSSLNQCFSTAGPWHQLYRATRGL